LGTSSSQAPKVLCVALDLVVISTGEPSCTFGLDCSSSLPLSLQAGILFYLFCTWFTDNFIVNFVIITVLMAADFWYTKRHWTLAGSGSDGGEPSHEQPVNLALREPLPHVQNVRSCPKLGSVDVVLQRNDSTDADLWSYQYTSLR
jgi:hypothetical protein